MISAAFPTATAFRVIGRSAFLCDRSGLGYACSIAEGGSNAASIASKHDAAVICFSRKTATLSAKVDKSARLWNKPTLVETDPFGRTRLS
jgi:hypothetical protein